MTVDVVRKELTDIVLSVMATATQLPVGDGEKPVAGGWQGQPNTTGSNFIPYNVLQASSATTSMGSFGHPQCIWQLPYFVYSFGVRRNQCEAIADRARDSLSTMTHQNYSLGSHPWTVMQIRVDSIGGVTRYDQFDPPYWGQVDTLTVWISEGA